MKENRNNTSIIYVAIPMDNDGCNSTSGIFVPTAIPAESTTPVLEEGAENSAEEKTTPSSQSRTAFLRAALIIAVGFIVTTLIALCASDSSNRQKSPYLRGGCHGRHPTATESSVFHGANINIPSHDTITNSDENQHDAKEYKTDGWYAGNESHDGWHATFAADEDDAVVERWMDEKEDGMIPGLP
mmetsp:Transcript_15062/g.32676  ORF Transcript_15062/g.32676 Transcript_15062/m.32676 type:complete len:186 (-) Transcript_15062:624-1181(-)